MSAPTLDALLAALRRRRDVGDWSASSRVATRAVRVLGSGLALTHRGDRAALAARLHVDASDGRGTAELAVDGDGAPAALVDDAVSRAAASVGPSWRASPASAPARVELHDDAAAVPEVAVDDLARAVEAEAARAGVAVIDAQVEVERAEVAVVTGRGLATQWRETTVGWRATVAVGGATARLAGTARRLRDLGLAGALAAAAARAAARAGARAMPPGVRDVLVGPALLGGDAAALLAPLAALADAGLHRQGLARTPVGAEIAAGAEEIPEPLTVRSDGTLPWGVRSAPVSVHGEPVRRFAVVEAGVLRGLALDEREAALRGAAPNGGVRGLVVSPGATPTAALRAPGVLELLEVSFVDVEVMTGELALGIGLALLHGDGGPTAVTGGAVRGDALLGLARARRGAEVERHAGYAGPAVLLPALEVG